MAVWIRRFERLPLFEERKIFSYGMAVLFSSIGWAVRWALDSNLPSGFPFLTFFPAVIVTSFLFGRGPGILAAVICALVAWYCFLPPAFTFGLPGNSALAMAFYVAVVSVDIAIIHWMQSANQRLVEEREVSRQLAIERGRLAERTELLFNELQHRVSNNLQMIGSVLSLQVRTVKDPAARRSLIEATKKLQLIGRIQRQLYDTSGAQVSVGVLMHELATDLVAASGKPGIHCVIRVTPGLCLAPDRVIPLALIMAESIANAIEHGFANRERGEIVIELNHGGGDIQLCVHDDGAGLPVGFDLDQTISLGLKVARALAIQLGATYRIEPAAIGTIVQLTFAAG